MQSLGIPATLVLPPAHEVMHTTYGITNTLPMVLQTHHTNVFSLTS